MSGSPKRQRISPQFNIGGEAAESDALLERAFFRSGPFQSAVARDQYECFLVGRTGAGKSAIIRMIEEEHSEHVLRISPEDISLPYITAIDVFRYLDSLDVNLDLLWIALWKHVILIEVLKHRYKVDSNEARKNVLETLRSAISRDSAKRLALEYLENFDGKFWAESDERVRQITDGIQRQITGEVGAKAGPLMSSLRAESSLTHDERVELSARYQHVVNDTQLPRLNKLIEMLNDDILDSSQNFVYVVIDDLDRDWADDRITNSLIRCLLRAVVDFQRVTNLKILVALRTNIFEGIDFGSRGGGQEEKIRALALPVVWNRASLTRLLDERVKAASAANSGHVQSAAEILPHSNSTRGNPLDYILERTLLRPRDAIAFLKECLRQSENKSSIPWDAIIQAEKTYSRQRLMALRDEWKGNYPGVDLFFEAFQGASGRLNKDEMAERLDAAVLKLADSSHATVGWLLPISEPILSGDPAMSWEGRYALALGLLYRLGLIGASPRSSAKPDFFWDSPYLMSHPDAIANLESFVVSRCYHSALGIVTSADQR